VALTITGGEWQGRKIATPTHNHVRPTTSRVRESFFSRLGSRIAGTRWLDGYAGSGVMGLEALSRGASQVIAVEGHRSQAKTIMGHRQAFNISAENYAVLPAKLEAVLARPPKGIQAMLPVDVMYLDPPYTMVTNDWWQGIQASLRNAAAPLLCPKQGQLWIEAPKSAHVIWPDEATMYPYGDTVLVCLPGQLFA
jgi:16S rRNA (guanine966-N2)-methyltransferase